MDEVESEIDEQDLISPAELFLVKLLWILDVEGDRALAGLEMFAATCDENFLANMPSLPEDPG